MIYLLYPVEIKLLAEYPNEIVLDRTDGIRVIPLESDALYEKQSIVRDSRKRIGNEIADDINLTDEQFSTFYNFTLGHLFIDPSDTEEFFTSSGIENIELIEKIRAFVDLENEFNIMNQLRDIFESL